MINPNGKTAPNRIEYATKAPFAIVGLLVLASGSRGNDNGDMAEVYVILNAPVENVLAALRARSIVAKKDPSVGGFAAETNNGTLSVSSRSTTINSGPLVIRDSGKFTYLGCGRGW